MRVSKFKMIVLVFSTSISAAFLSTARASEWDTACGITRQLIRRCTVRIQSVNYNDGSRGAISTYFLPGGETHEWLQIHSPGDVLCSWRNTYYRKGQEAWIRVNSICEGGGYIVLQSAESGQRMFVAAQH